jgi:hypothetical protein
MCCDKIKYKPAYNSVYKQLLYVPVRANKVSFPTNKVGLGQLLKASVSGYRSGTEDATAHTRKRCAQVLKKPLTKMDTYE